MAGRSRIWFRSNRQGVPSCPESQGFRLGADGYEPIPSEAKGGLLSAELGLRLALANGRLELYGQTTGQRLLDRHEREEAAAQRAKAAEQRAAAAGASPLRITDHGSRPAEPAAA